MTTQRIQPKDKMEVLPSVSAMLDAAQAVRDAVKQLNLALAKAHNMRIKTNVVRVTAPSTYPPQPPKAQQFTVKAMVIDL